MGTNLIRKDSSPFTAEQIDEFYPENQPLCAKYKKGFGYKTIGYRLPVIITKVIDQAARDKNEIGDVLGLDAREEVKDIVGAIAQVKNEMTTNKPIKPTGNTVWDEYLRKVADRDFKGDLDGVRWYMAPWLFVECYLYFRMNLAIHSTKHLQSYDPFQKQKRDALVESLDACDILGQYLESNNLAPEAQQVMLEVSVWGNRCDLSISAGESNSQMSQDIVNSIAFLREKILADDSAQFWQAVKSKNKGSVGYVLDNAGYELFTDFCLADILLAQEIATDVVFYVKEQPWFVSDATEPDIAWTLDRLIESGKDHTVLRHLGNKWKKLFESGRFSIASRPFWTYPHAYYEMKQADSNLYEELASKAFLVFKGDLNYRKLINDTNWNFNTTFNQALQGFKPTSLIALRTLKADTVAGLPPGVGEQLSKSDRDWMVTGDYGLIQFVQ